MYTVVLAPVVMWVGGGHGRRPVREPEFVSLVALSAGVLGRLYWFEGPTRRLIGAVRTAVAVGLDVGLRVGIDMAVPPLSS